MKTLMMLLLVWTSAQAETVRLTDSVFAKTTVAIVDSPFAHHSVYFSKSTIGSDCGLYITDSAFAMSTVRVVKNPIVASTTVREVKSRLKANSIVHIVKSPIAAFGHCDFAAGLIKK